MKFATSIHCMDGRIQEPVINYLKNKYNVIYVDTITEPGPNKIIADNSDNFLIENIKKRIDISVKKHKSELIVISGHYDCAGNPVDEETQNKQTKESMKFLKSNYPEVNVIGLWINDKWEISEI